jgi:serine/threonine-protein kinase
MIGSTLLNYRVTAKLGAGGLGTVYAAEHLIIGRKAALKVLDPVIARDEAMVQRFLVEARAVAAIRHPNIVDVTDYGKADGNFVIVMELLDGETLGARLEREGMLEERKAVSLMIQLASAVGGAHERNIVHRDLKPDNIFLTSYPDYPDFVKVLDFGIAKLLGSDGSLKTSPGLIIGTPAFMSPEQCMGDENLDGRSDIYSLGVVGYRMLTGQLPHVGNIMQQMQGHLSRTPKHPGELRPELSPAITALVMKCMARAPADRYQSMRELRAALATLGVRPPLSFSEEEAAPQPPARREASAPPPPPSPSTARLPPPVPEAGPVLQPEPDAFAPAAAPPPPSPPRQDTRGFEGQRTEELERAQAVAVAAKMREIISKRLASDSLRLPSLPEVAVKCLQRAHDPDTTFAELGDIIGRDPFIASRVVRVSNSPLYGGLARITSIDGAVARMGIKTLVGLLQELAAEQVFISKDPTIRNAFRGIWEHCLGVANLSRDLARTLRTVEPNTAYLGGLFHDIGKPVVAALLLEAERGAQAKAWVSGGVWRRVVDEIHRDVGAIIAVRWYLPREVATAVAELDWYDLRRGKQSAANVVRLANALCQRDGLDVKAGNPQEVGRVITQGRQVLGLSDEQLATATRGLVNRVQALTAERAEEGSTRVFDRSQVV